MYSTPLPQADLLFPESYERTGFTSIRQAAHSDVNATTIIRELIQNSLDAAQEREDTDKAIIRFEIERNTLSEIPGIDSYKRAFEYAVKLQRKINPNGLSDQAQVVIDSIERCLANADLETLFVSDNGIGLNRDSMLSLLGDGISDKPSTSSGAVGNGHFTVLQSSDLRFVFYGGISSDGNSICSGNAILASFEDEHGGPKSSNGYFACGLQPNIKNPFDFPQAEKIPPFISKQLNWIKAQWQVGTVVAIPGFNYFRDKKEDIWDSILEAAACNFFVAIQQEKLCIIFNDGNKEEVLNHSNLSDKLNLFKDRKRSKYASGKDAYRAYQTMQSKDSTIEIDDATHLMFKLRRDLSSEEGASDIGLCRNGMWITKNDQISGILKRSHFSSYAPFHCLVLLSSHGKNRNVHNLVRKAEGPLHNEIHKKNLGVQDKKLFDKTWQKLREYLKDNLDKLQYQSFTIDDLFTVQRGSAAGLMETEPNIKVRKSSEGNKSGDGDGKEGKNADDTNNNGKVNANAGDDNEENKVSENKNSYRRSGKSIQFSAIPVTVGDRARKVQITPTENVAHSEVMFTLDEGLDDTCPSYDIRKEDFIYLDSEVILNNKRVSNGNFIYDGKETRIIGVKLGELIANESILLEFKFNLPTDVSVNENIPIALKVQLKELIDETHD